MNLSDFFQLVSLSKNYSTLTIKKSLHNNISEKPGCFSMPVGVKFQFAISKKGELKTSKSDFCPHFGGKFPTVHPSEMGVATSRFFL